VKFGLFYYAGHGFQLDWHNYLLPVSAKVRKPADVPAQAVDVGHLIRYMEQAKGRSFLIILDACRNDPFAGMYRPPAKGLSQFDAPPGSLLAFATGPGAEAQDGEGKNGLYTGFLLREFAVPGARLEDAFKRVRLGVRLASNGAQIPWESTSLEEDIYLFPVAARKLSDAERDELLEREMTTWLRVKSSPDPEVLAGFIRQYPSGSASELAQSRMNRLLATMAAREAQRIASAAESAAKAAKELAALEEAARRLAAQTEERRVAAQRAEEERVRLAQLEAARQEAQRQRLEAQVAQQQQAQAAAFELQRIKDLQSQREVSERALALQAVQANSEFLRMETAQQQEAGRLAQQMRDRLVVSTPTGPATLSPTPFFKGYDEHRRQYRTGDEFNILVIDMYTKAAAPLVLKVTQVDLDAERVIFNDGEYQSDLMGNITSNPYGSFSTPRQFYPAELIVGKRWSTRFKQSRPDGSTYTFQYDLKVTAKENITVPAGTFEAYKIEARGLNIERGAALERTIWVKPGINADIAHEIKVRHRNGFVEQNDRQELVSIVQAER
jgi:pyruvate/2-oxoglutarate dehydrogenase complex dihydrolipoamide acyltransferase (E2) component